MNSTKTFAETTAHINFPKKDQAIVMNILDEIPQIEYVKAISKLTEPKNIIFASRLSNNRFCLYLSSKEIVDNIITKHSSVYINDQTITIRRLINPAKRVIISNAHPVVPHDIIMEALLLEGIKTVSPISFMKAGYNDELSHVISFRRQVYIHPDDSENMPGSLIIKHDGTDYRIFLTDDTITCFLCKLPGHTSQYCKKTPKNNPITTETNNISQNNSTSTETEPISSQNQTNLNKKVDEEKTDTINDTTLPLNFYKSQTIKDKISKNDDKTKKRPPPSSSSSPSSPSQPQTQNTTQEIMHSTPICSNVTSSLQQKLIDTSKTKSPNLKKLKKSNSLENFLFKLDESLQPAKDYLDNLATSDINYLSFLSLTENLQECVNSLSILEQYNVTPQDIIIIIENVHRLVSDRSLKIRLSRTLTKIKKDSNIL